MPHQFCADALALILVNHSKCDFSFPWMQYNVATSANDCGTIIFLYHGYESHMIDEVDVCKERNLPIRKMLFYREEPAEE